MLRRPFHGQYRLTQGFGENPASYAPFGIKGHNGLDYGLPHGTELVSPIDGKITEVGNDTTGYGAYVKVENSVEGHLLGHMSRIDVQVGQEVYEGQTLGLSGGTKGSWGAGNTTGAHLHWGRFPIPRNRQNGYSGYEDQSDLLISWEQQLNLPKGRTYVNKPANETVAVDAKEFPKLVTKATRWDETVRDVIKTDRKSEEVSTQELKDLVGNLQKQRDEAIKSGDYNATELRNREEQVERLKTEKADLQKAYDRLKTDIASGDEVAQAQRKADKELIDKLQKQVTEQAKTIGDLNHTVDEQATTITNLGKELEQSHKEGVHNLTIYDAVELIVIKVITALKSIKLKWDYGKS